jgi:Ulp1 family protease
MINLLSEFGVQIFIPIHRDLHWCLAVINMKEETYQYLDSFGVMDFDVLRILVGLTDVLEINYHPLR